MDKILFSNSFKNLMVALGAKTSDSSYAVPLINKTSGAPQGYMDMSALASVLGGVVTTLSNSTSLNDCTTPGLYQYKSTNPSMEGVPADLTIPFLMEVKGFSDSTVRLQIIYEVGGFHSTYIRNYSAAQNRWMDWDKFTGERLT